MSFHLPTLLGRPIAMKGVMCAGPGLKGPGNVHLCPLGMSDRPVQSPEGLLTERSRGDGRKPRASTQAPDPPWGATAGFRHTSEHRWNLKAANPLLPTPGGWSVHGQASEGGRAAHGRVQAAGCR